MNYAPILSTQIQRLAKRRRRDLNPRAAINDLLPFQGSPFSLLGTSPDIPSKRPRIVQVSLAQNGEGGIRTHAPLRTNGFQDRLVMTTSIPLRVRATPEFKSSAKIILAKIDFHVNRFFYFFTNSFLTPYSSPIHRDYRWNSLTFHSTCAFPLSRNPHFPNRPAKIDSQTDRLPSSHPTSRTFLAV